jgi:uncharacterized membrane protein YgcG
VTARTLCLLRRLVGLALLIGLVAVATVSARAAEEIRAFDSLVVVQPDGALEVTERIMVRAEGRQIRRGIFRDFPTIRREPSGLVSKASFELLGATRDGKPEMTREESITGGRRVYLGNPDVYLQAGVYTYEIRYRTRRQLRHFADYDEVYWNATGNFWAFPILRASATIVLPDGARILRRAAYTGRFGESGSDARVVEESARGIRFVATRPLGTGEGLTVAVAFPKGLVPEPGALARQGRFLWDNIGLILLVLAVPGLGLYYLRAWRRYGVDPPKGVIIPLFEPPRGFSPAGVSYVFYRGLNARVRGVSRAFVAALMSLAVKGLITLKEEDDEITLTRRVVRGPGGRGFADKDYDSLPAGEKALISGFLDSRDEFVVGKQNQTTIRGTLARFHSAVNGEHGEKYFKYNLRWTILGIVLTVLVFVAFLATWSPTDGQIGVFAGAIPLALVGTVIVVAGLRRIFGDTPGGRHWLGPPLVLIGLAIAAPLIGGVIVAPMVMSFMGEPESGWLAPILIVGSVILLIGLNIMFGWLMFAPTPEGRKVMDEIEGFRLYLSVAEADRMNMAGRPDFSVELFEKYLPYAIALGVEKPWSRSLEEYLKKAQPGERTASYTPRFYSGRNWSSLGAAAASVAIASTLGSSFASAMPSQSSGSGGGGSSGGGGGGGGGGGW